MFSEYIQAALTLAEYDTLEDGSYVATVVGLQGVIAIGDTIEECRKDLIEVIEGWIALRLRFGEMISPINII
ncbi:MAG TPA: type II toxin-antitoxin system HicB family antitoxin [Methanothrix sp.]|nr:type II toxin-antitoxin system HicB family antitoxin [Methanothrix sp.]